MKTLTLLLLNFTAFGLLTPISAVAHPGHQHAPGILYAANHATIGWNQLLILFAVGAMIVHILLRARK